MALRDKLGVARTPRPQQQQQPAAPAAKPGKPAVARTENVAAACGHEVVFELSDDKKDRYRDARRKKITDRPCPECRRKAHEERAAAQKAEAAARRAAAGPKAGKPRRQLESQGRLPDGAHFSVAFDAGAVLWRGSLHVPDGDSVKTFAGEKSGVFPLLTALDAQFRAWQAARAAPEGTPAPEAPDAK